MLVWPDGLSKVFQACWGSFQTSSFNNWYALSQSFEKKKARSSWHAGSCSVNRRKSLAWDQEPTWSWTIATSPIFLASASLIPPPFSLWHEELQIFKICFNIIFCICISHTLSVQRLLCPFIARTTTRWGRFQHSFWRNPGSAIYLQNTSYKLGKRGVQPSENFDDDEFIVEHKPTPSNTQGRAEEDTDDLKEVAPQKTTTIDASTLDGKQEIQFVLVCSFFLLVHL